MYIWTGYIWFTFEQWNNPHVNISKHTLNKIEDTSQSHQYNITSLTEKPDCAVRTIYNLSSSRLKEVQNERKSRIREVLRHVPKKQDVNGV